MAAISGLGITNLLIKINSNEVPILDGSSKEFVEKLKKLVSKIKKTSKNFKNFKKIEYREKEKFIRISPTEKNFIYRLYNRL